MLLELSRRAWQQRLAGATHNTYSRAECKKLFCAGTQGSVRQKVISSAGSFWNLASRQAMARETGEAGIKHKHLPPRLGDQQVFVITVKLSARNIG